MHGWPDFAISQCGFQALRAHLESRLPKSPRAGDLSKGSLRCAQAPRSLAKLLERASRAADDLVNIIDILNADHPSAFPNTRWSVVVQLRSRSDAHRSRAFEELCTAYWKPLYTFARRCGHAPHDAEDLTQGFFTQLLLRDNLGPLAPEHGRLRTFLKTSFRNFITDAARHGARQKRGGGSEILSLDMASAERQYLRTLGEATAPDEAFDRQWARTILRRALDALREKFQARGRTSTLRELEIFLGPDEGTPAYAEVAARLGQTENTIAAAVRRMREEFRTLLRREIADTLAEGEDLDEELRYLLRLAG